jgi:hypothetical protein
LSEIFRFPQRSEVISENLVRLAAACGHQVEVINPMG